MGVGRNREWGYTQASCGYGSISWPCNARLNCAQNADNYAVFALCITMLELDCLDKYAEGIRKRNSLPFVPSPEAVKKSDMRSDT